MFPLANVYASMLFAAGCGLLTMILIRMTYKRLGKRNRRRNEPAIAAQPRPITPWAGAHADVAARLNRQEVELHDRAREVTAQIDSKMILLRELIEQSQQQATRLEALLAEAEEKETADAR